MTSIVLPLSTRRCDPGGCKKLPRTGQTALPACSWRDDQPDAARLTGLRESKNDAPEVPFLLEERHLRHKLRSLLGGLVVEVHPQGRSFTANDDLTRAFLDLSKGDQHALQHAGPAGETHLVQQLDAPGRTVALQPDCPHQRLQVGCLIPGIGKFQFQQILCVVVTVFK